MTSSGVSSRSSRWPVVSSGRAADRFWPTILDRLGAFLGRRRLSVRAMLVTSQEDSGKVRASKIDRLGWGHSPPDGKVARTMGHRIEAWARARLALPGDLAANRTQRQGRPGLGPGNVDHRMPGYRWRAGPAPGNRRTEWGAETIRCFGSARALMPEVKRDAHSTGGSTDIARRVWRFGKAGPT